MSNVRRFLGKLRLQVLSVIAPKKAGQIATKLFTQSRNEANPHRKAFTPIGAKAITISDPTSKVKNIYLWGDEGEIVLLVHGWGQNVAVCLVLFPNCLNKGIEWPRLMGLPMAVQKVNIPPCGNTLNRPKWLFSN